MVVKVEGQVRKKTETLAEYSRLLSGQDTSKINNLSRISKISGVPGWYSKIDSASGVPPHPQISCPSSDRRCAVNYFCGEYICLPDLWKQSISNRVWDPAGSPFLPKRAGCGKRSELTPVPSIPCRISNPKNFNYNDGTPLITTFQWLFNVYFFSISTH